MRPSLVLWLIVLIPYHASALVTNQHKFDFLPVRSQPYFGPVSRGLCNSTLAIYEDYWNEPIQDLKGIQDAVYNHQECILANSTENVKATMSSASVLLGLAPVLLQTAGPSVNELGLMSMQRPGLAMLLALGTAAIFPSRMFGYREESFEGLGELVKGPSLMPPSMIYRLEKRGSTLHSFVCAVQYLVAAVSIFNTIYTGYQLGVASVNSFDCTNSMWPLIWTLIPLVMHAFTAWSFWLSREKARKTTLSSILRSSVTISFAQEAPPVQKLTPNLVSSLFYWITSVIGFVHGVFGILIFSSLLFVQIGDAVTILLRYFASTVACQAVIAFEISGMRAATKRANAGKNEADMGDINQA